ncbi:MAG: AMED_5909 family protein [Pseudonocardiaceae bacterium]
MTPQGGTRKPAATDTGKTTKPTEPRTLIQAHEALVRIRPKGDASPEQWRVFYERSVALYLEIAEIDRGHHHEALYWAEREQLKADEFAARSNAEKSQ